MKTINDISRETGITRQTLYRKLSQAGLKAESLSTEKHGTTLYFNEEAEKKIVDVISRNSNKDITVTVTMLQARETIKRQKDDISKLQQRAEELQKQLDELKRERDQLKEDNSLLIKMNATQTIMIQRYQERETEKLTNGAEEQRTTSAGWIRRALARITGKGKKEE